MMAGKLFWESEKNEEFYLGKDTVIMAARGRNRPLVVASLLLEVS